MTSTDGSVQPVLQQKDQQDFELDQMLDGFELKRVASHLLRRAHFRAEDIYSQTAGRLGLTPRQKALLIVAYRNPRANQSVLAEMIALDPNSLAEMATRMVREGLLQRTRDPHDARSKCISITDAGVDILKKIMPLDAQVETDVLAPVPHEHRALFVHCLQLMVGIQDPIDSVKPRS